MTPTLRLLANAIKTAITDKQVTAAGVDHLRSLGVSVLEHDTSSADELRDAFRWALGAGPEARSFQTDSGAGASRNR